MLSEGRKDVSNLDEEPQGFRSGSSRTRLEEIAYEQGRRDADVDGHLRSLRLITDSHESRLNAINGSVARSAAAQEKLHKSVESLRDELKELVSSQAIRDAIQDDHDEQENRGLSKLQKWSLIIGVPSGITIPIICSFIAAGKLF